MVNEIKIGSRLIGANHSPFVIAELSGNHDQSLQKALEMVEVAARCGVDAVKLQTYTPDSITLNVRGGDFEVKHPLWGGQSLYELYEKACTPYEWHAPLFKRCKELGMLGFSSPFDEAAVDFLEELDVPCYKIASFEHTHFPLIRRVARTGKPLIISFGVSTLVEIAEAVDVAREAGIKDIILMKCSSTYPAQIEDTNLLTIPHMRQLFGLPVGYSDHTLGIGAAVASVALGAVAIEKHFTLARADKGVDAAFSLEPEELKSLVIEAKRAKEALGSITYEPSQAERESFQYKRSLYIAKDLQKGEVLSADNVRIVRPGFGMAVRHYDTILGKSVKLAVKKGTALSWDLIG
jgi:pseudaminic acid synthase